MERRNCAKYKKTLIHHHHHNTRLTDGRRAEVGRARRNRRVLPRARRLEISPTVAMAQRAQALRARGVRVYDFTVGEPDQPTPPSIVAAAYEAMLAGRTAARRLWRWTGRFAGTMVMVRLHPPVHRLRPGAPRRRGGMRRQDPVDSIHRRAAATA